jgi:PadR family transcriptional regulator
MQCMEPGDDTKWLPQVRRGVAEQCVLALLTRGEKYGFELARELGARGQIIASEGTLYPLLARLRRNGFVATSWRESNSGPPRRYYHLTRDGELALASFTKQWRVFRDAVDDILSEGNQQ